ncbi:MAG: hypothetical protein TR69_WS6001001457 [candidate division WS6 bacterium OLB20]|uniref:Uncharacterized protein n=1 Tax=candidate division WS6 bacterium OLB20 TaxID=1617426 RepID=A0A136LW18_9BACT|nr:MAG: hypothetical protein TR69_WS6001001457 [candidate division WS6 bacterium OLB20]
MRSSKNDNDFSLVVVERFEGLDFVDVVDESNFEMYVERMLQDIYKPLLTSTDRDLLPVGIDTSVRNFVYRIRDGEFCYVDFMPPKVFYRGHYTQEVPEISGPFYDIRMLTHNDRKGVVYSVYINLARLFPAKRKAVISKLEQFLVGIAQPDLMEHIVSSPFYRLSEAKDAINIVNAIQDWKGISYLHLREAACIAAEYNDSFRQQLEDFFKLTHHETDTDSSEYGLLPARRFDAAKAMLIDAFTLNGAKSNP